MKRIPHPLKSILAAAGAVAIMALGGSLPAFADSPTVTSPTVGATISGGSNGLSGGQITFGGFSASLTGVDQQVTGSWNISNIVDQRGTGAGWKVTLSLPPLVDSNGHHLGTISLLAAPTPSSSTNITVLSTQQLDTNQPIAIVTGAADTTDGTTNGTFSFVTQAHDLQLDVPANAFAGNYSATATVSLYTSPS